MRLLFKNKINSHSYLPDSNAGDNIKHYRTEIFYEKLLFHLPKFWRG
jgi:hypothetical protein